MEREDFLHEKCTANLALAKGLLQRMLTDHNVGSGIIYERVLAELLSGQDAVMGSLDKQESYLYRLGNKDILADLNLKVKKESIHQVKWAIEYEYNRCYAITNCNDIKFLYELDLYVPAKIMALVKWDIVKVYGRYYHLPEFCQGSSTEMVESETLPINCTSMHVLTKITSTLEAYLNYMLNNRLLPFRVKPCLGSFQITVTPSPASKAETLLYQLKCCRMNT